MATTSNLWDKAFESLPPDLKTTLERTRTHRRDILEAVTKEAEGKRDLCLRKRWKFKKPSGEIVILRDLLEKIVIWVQRFKETGDIMVQFDPSPAALGWGAIRFLLQVSVSEVQVFGAMIDDLANIARIITRYAIFEKHHLRGTPSEIHHHLEEALTRLYSEILTHLGSHVKFFRETSMTRLIKSPFRSVNPERDQALKDKEREVDKYADLSGFATLKSLEEGFSRVSIAATQSLSNEQFDDILDWLAVVPYYRHHQYVAQSHDRGVGDWLLKHPEFNSWRHTSSSSLLLLHGIPGSGKSTLSSVVINYFQNAMEKTTSNSATAAPFGFFYCANPASEPARRSSDDVMRSILFQLALDPTEGSNIKEFLCAEHRRQRIQARAGKLDMVKLVTKDCIRLILELAENDPMTIVIDGLDTLDDGERAVLIEALREIVSKSNNVAKVFVSSRTTYHPAALPLAERLIQITADHTRPDMERYLDGLLEVSLSRKLLLGGHISLESLSLVRETLLNSAGEMFLWTKLQVERLCRSTLEADLRAALQDNFICDIDQLYEESFNRILNSGREAREIAKKVLACVMYAREPLAPNALAEAFTTDRGTTLGMAQIGAICEGLIVVDGPSDVLRFSHQSAQDFLERCEMFRSATAQTLMATVCVEACRDGHPITSEQIQDVPLSSFYTYASMHWPVHVEAATTSNSDNEPSTDLDERVTTFIFDEEWDTSLSFESWIANIRKISSLLPMDHPMKPRLRAITASAPEYLFLIAVSGLSKVLATVLSHASPLDLNQRNDLGHTALYLAAAFGHLKTAEVLINNGAALNVRGGRHGSPLHAACFLGHMNIASLLLSKGAHVGLGSVYNDAFQAACRGRREETALHLLEEHTLLDGAKGFEEAVDDAAIVGFASVVRKLYSLRPMQSDDPPTKMKRKLSLAIQRGHLGLVRQFLNQDSCTRELIPKDAIALASVLDHRPLIEFLLEQKLDLEAEGAFGSPLRTACLFGHRSLVELLLEKGADIKAIGSYGDALQAAATAGHSSVIQFLIGEGADVSQESGFFGTALHAAAYHGHSNAVVVLLDAGASFYTVWNSKDAFYAAAEGGHQNINTLMLKRGYNLDTRTFRSDFAAARLAPPRPGHQLRDASPSRSSYRKEATPRRVGRDRAQWESNIALGPERALAGEMDGVLSADPPSPDDLGSPDLSLQQITPEASRSTDYTDHALKGAASAGSLELVTLLLDDNLTPGSTAGQVMGAVKASVENGHPEVLQYLLNYAAQHRLRVDKESIQELSQSLPRNSGQVMASCNPRVASEYVFSENYAAIYASLKYANLLPVEKYQTDEVDPDTIVADFEESCATGDHTLMSAILASPAHLKLSEDNIRKGVYICGHYGSESVAQLLLGATPLKDRLPISGEDFFLEAVSGGFIGLMQVFDQHWPGLLTPDSTASRQALIMSCEQGHLDIVKLLVEDFNLDVNGLYPDRRSLSGSEYSPFRDYLLLWSLPDAADSLLHDERVISPLQAALRGNLPALGIRRRISRDYDRRKDIALQPSLQRRREMIIEFLLRNGAILEDFGGQNQSPIEVAVECSETIFTCLLAYGADPNTVVRGADHVERSVMFSAAGQGRFSLTFVQHLLEAGANIPEDLELQKLLIDEALKNFSHSSQSCRDSKTQTLATTFENGPAALLFFLLTKMPRIQTANNDWALVLQMAAFLNNHRFVDLLLSRGTNLNHVGYYYGSALAAAARCGHDDMVKKLLQAGARVELLVVENHCDLGIGLFDIGPPTALHAALASKRQSTVRLLLSKSARIMEKHLVQKAGSFPWQDSLLKMAVSTRDPEIVRLFVEKGWDPQGHKQDEQYPLILAASSGDEDSVKILLDAGAAADSRGRRRGFRGLHEASALHAACAGGHLNIVQLLWRRGAHIREIQACLDEYLYLAASNGKTSVVEYLLSQEAQLDGSERPGSNKALQIACERGDLRIIDMLIDKLPTAEAIELALDDILARSVRLSHVARHLLGLASPSQKRLVQACSMGILDSVDNLLSSDAVNIDAPAEHGGPSPLRVAVQHRQTDVVRKLLSVGADVNCEDDNVDTLLNETLWSCHHDSADISFIFELTQREETQPPGARSGPKMIRYKPIRFSADSSGSDTDSPSAIYDVLDFTAHRPYGMVATHSLACMDIARLLVSHGTNVARIPNSVTTPVVLATLLGSKTIVEMLIENSPEAYMPPIEFQLSLFAAVRKWNVSLISILAEPARTLEFTHPTFGTALHYACRLNAAPVARKLIELGASLASLDDKGQSPLSTALLHQLPSGDEHSDIEHFDPDRPRLEVGSSKLSVGRFAEYVPICPRENVLDVLTDTQLVKRLYLSRQDLEAAAKLTLSRSDGRLHLLRSLLCLDPDVVVPESLVHDSLQQDPQNTKLIELLISRTEAGELAHRGSGVF